MGGYEDVELKILDSGSRGSLKMQEDFDARSSTNSRYCFGVGGSGSVIQQTVERTRTTF